MAHRRKLPVRRFRLSVNVGAVPGGDEIEEESKISNAAQFSGFCGGDGGDIGTAARSRGGIGAE